MDKESKKKSRQTAGPSLKGTLILSAGLVLAAVIAVMSYYIFGVQSAVRQQAEESFEQVTNASLEQMERVFNSSQDSAVTAAYSNATQIFLLSGTPGSVIEAKSSAADVLTYIRTLGYGFEDVTFFSFRGRKLSATNAYSDVVQAAWEKAGIGNDLIFSKSCYVAVQGEDEQDYVVYLFPVYGSIDGYRYRFNPILGGVVYRMDRLVESLIPVGYHSGAAVLVDGGKILGGTRSLDADEAHAISQIPEGESFSSIGGEQYLTSRRTVEGPEWELIYLVPVADAVSAVDQMRNPLVMVILVSVLGFLLLMFLILARVRQDIANLSADIGRLGETSTVRQPNIQELRPVSAVLNRTMERLKEAAFQEQKLTRMTYEAQLAQYRAEMLAYRSQINPHFLFNTLETARALAHRYKAQPVEQLVGGMSQMFRYSIYAPAFVPLEEELGQLGGYLSVMDVRFPGYYRVLEDIDPDTLSWPLLPMLLQPLVENALTHAFPTRRGNLLVQSFIQQNRLHVRIADNGIGIPQKQLEEIHWKMRHTEGETASASAETEEFGVPKGSIGLPNIYRRLKLTFGDHAHLLLRSKEGYYTVAELVIPDTRGKLS